MDKQQTQRVLPERTLETIKISPNIGGMLEAAGELPAAAEVLRLGIRQPSAGVSLTQDIVPAAFRIAHHTNR